MSLLPLYCLCLLVLAVNREAAVVLLTDAPVPTTASPTGAPTSPAATLLADAKLPPTTSIEVVAVDELPNAEDTVTPTATVVVGATPTAAASATILDDVTELATVLPTAEAELNTTVDDSTKLPTKLYNWGPPTTSASAITHPHGLDSEVETVVEHPTGSAYYESVFTVAPASTDGINPLYSPAPAATTTAPATSAPTSSAVGSVTATPAPTSTTPTDALEAITLSPTTPPSSSAPTTPASAAPSQAMAATLSPTAFVGAVSTFGNGRSTNVASDLHNDALSWLAVAASMFLVAYW